MAAPQATTTNNQDVMIDTPPGQVDHVTRPFGGLLGTGDKLSALSMEALRAVFLRLAIDATYPRAVPYAEVRLRRCTLLIGRVLASVLPHIRTMKNILICGALVLLAAACRQQPPEESTAYQSLSSANDSLLAVIREKEQQVDEVANSITEIESNLGAIERDRMAITDLQQEGRGRNQQERINEMITGIDSYIDENRRKIERLEAQVRNATNTSAGLNRLIAQLKRSVEEKEAEIEQLRGNVAMMQGEVDTLRTKLQRREEELAASRQRTQEQETSMTTAYFRVGNRRELADDDVVDREGGVLGIGRTLKLAPNLDRSKFTQVNTRYLNQIALGDTRRHNLVSAHPEGSFSFEETDENVYLKIEDPDQFWSASRFLVIEVD
ncbi:MAG: hypothetical protein WBA12_13495 [Catalinimonas sp.]